MQNPIQECKNQFEMQNHPGCTGPISKCDLRFEMRSPFRNALCVAKCLLLSHMRKHISKWNLCLPGILDASPHSETHCSIRNGFSISTRLFHSGRPRRPLPPVPHPHFEMGRLIRKSARILERQLPVVSGTPFSDARPDSGLLVLPLTGRVSVAAADQLKPAGFREPRPGSKASLMCVTKPWQDPDGPLWRQQPRSRRATGVRGHGRVD